MQRIVRLSGYGQHRIARAQNRKQRNGKRMRTGRNQRRHYGFFRIEHIGIQRIQRIPSDIVVPVAARRRKMPQRDFVRAESVQYFFLILVRRFVDSCKLRAALGFCFIYKFGNVHTTPDIL